MCIGVPMQVLEIESGRALCRDEHETHWVDIRLVERPSPGAWLLVFADAARELISAERAAQVGNALKALHASATGDRAGIDALFADLVDREPQLPPHLQAELNRKQNKEH